MRGFVSLLFAAALAAHLGPAGAPSLGGRFFCAGESGPGVSTGAQALLPVVAATPAEASTGARERGHGGGPGWRKARATRGFVPSPVSPGASGHPAAVTPPALLGFPGHPATAPPSQA